SHLLSLPDKNNLVFTSMVYAVLLTPFFLYLLKAGMSFVQFQKLQSLYIRPNLKSTGMFKRYSFTAAERFMRYVQIDTQSDPLADRFPSTEKQKDLGRLLVQELLDMGITDAHMDDWGY